MDFSEFGHSVQRFGAGQQIFFAATTVFGGSFRLIRMKGKVSPKRNATRSPCQGGEFVSNSEPMHRIPETVELAQTLKEVPMKNNSILNSLVLAKKRKAPIDDPALTSQLRLKLREP